MTAKHSLTLNACWTWSLLRIKVIGNPPVLRSANFLSQGLSQLQEARKNVGVLPIRLAREVRVADMGKFIIGGNSRNFFWPLGSRMAESEQFVRKTPLATFGQFTAFRECLRAIMPFPDGKSRDAQA
jgi:hypothetical protein